MYAAFGNSIPGSSPVLFEVLYIKSYVKYGDFPVDSFGPQRAHPPPFPFLWLSQTSFPPPVIWFTTASA
jgi:hypothetical protein